MADDTSTVLSSRGDPEKLSHSSASSSAEAKQRDEAAHPPTWDASKRRYSSESLPRAVRVKSDARSHTSKTGKLVGRDSHLSISRRQTAREALERGDAIWVEWDGPDDPTNPFNWSRRRKWIITGLCCWFTFLTAFCGSSFATNLLAIRQDLGVSFELSLLATAIYPFGFGLAPLVTAPFSEVFGRNGMYLVTFAIHGLHFLPVALIRNIAAIIVFRFIGGCAGSTGSTMVGGSISDIWSSAERGAPMALFSLAAFVGSGGGPAFFGYIPQTIGWQWTQWIQLIVAGITFVLLAVFLRETRGTVILSRKAARLRKETGDDRYQCRADAERASLVTLVKVSLTRPLWFLITEPVVMALTAWISLSWGVMWGLLEALGHVMNVDYGFDTGQQGLCFFSLVIGAVLGVATNFVQERIYRAKFPTKGPEARLYASLVCGPLLPVGLYIFGASQGRGHWIGPLVGTTLVMIGIFHIYIATFLYLADAYQLYASSALAAQSFVRNMVGSAFVLFVVQSYDNLGFTNAAILYGSLGVILTAVPYILFWRGPQIRARSRVVQQLRAIAAAAEAEQERSKPMAAKEP